MGAVILLLAFIGAIVLIAYLKFPPPFAKKKLVGTFDAMVMGVCALLCLVWALNAHSSLSGTANEEMWEALAVAGALGIEIVFLGLCFIARNFWVFRPPRGPGRGGLFGF